MEFGYFIIMLAVNSIFWFRVGDDDTDWVASVMGIITSIGLLAAYYALWAIEKGSK